MRKEDSNFSLATYFSDLLYRIALGYQTTISSTMRFSQLALVAALSVAAPATVAFTVPRVASTRMTTPLNMAIEDLEAKLLGRTVEEPKATKKPAATPKPTPAAPKPAPVPRFERPKVEKPKPEPKTSPPKVVEKPKAVVAEKPEPKAVVVEKAKPQPVKKAAKLIPLPPPKAADPPASGDISTLATGGAFQMECQVCHDVTLIVLLTSALFLLKRGRQSLSVGLRLL